MIEIISTGVLIIGAVFAALAIGLAFFATIGTVLWIADSLMDGWFPDERRYVAKMWLAAFISAVIGGAFIGAAYSMALVFGPPAKMFL